MRRSKFRLATYLAAALALGVPLSNGLEGEEPAAEALQSGIGRATRALLKAQQGDGSWMDRREDDPHVIGTTSIAVLALLRSGMKADDPEIRRGLDWLRQQDPILTKEISLMIQALVAAGDRERDIERLTAQGDSAKGDRGERPTKKPIEDACGWLGEQFSVERNPGGGPHWILYYLDVLAQSGRITDRQFFVDRLGRRHDWFAEGATFLLRNQNSSDGTWRDFDTGPVVSTSFALLFLSRARAKK